jgi:hypothetical protein
MFSDSGTDCSIFSAIVFNFNLLEFGVIKLLIAAIAWVEFSDNSFLVIDLVILFSIAFLINSFSHFLFSCC